MPFYLFQAAYKDAQLKARLDAPANREQAGREFCESFGGKQHQWFMAFGEWDVIGIGEFPRQRDRGGGRHVYAIDGHL